MKKVLSYLIATLFLSSYAFSQTVGLIQHSTNSLDDGYVLFAPNTSKTTYLIDKCGKKIKTWTSTYRPGLSCDLLPDGTLLRTGNTNNTTFNVGGKGGIVEKIDWDENVTWSYTVSDETKCQHHDVKALPNGNILILAWESKTKTQAIIAGINPSLAPTTTWSEQILEVQPTGTNGGIIVWEWHLWDHLVQDYDQTKSNYGEVSSSPQLININYKAKANNSDWIHLNSIDYNPVLDQIVLSSHNFDEVWIIDHSTTTEQAASNIGGNSGKGGDLLYRWGNPEAYNNGTSANKKLYGQHNAYWIPNGYPFENQIMIFNNGIGRPGGNYSTVEIINPPVDGYNYNTTLPYLPTSTSWNYNYGNPNNLYSQNISGAQQLSNGNVLVCNGGSGSFTETTTSGTQVWKYINPVKNTGTISQGTNPTMNSVFRCLFYPNDYSGFEGHSLTAGNTIENTNSISESCNLTISSYSINASVLPENSGNITGAGDYDYGSNVSLAATPTTGYTFKDWTENGIQVSTETTYSFTANTNRSLVANFTINSYSINANLLPENSGTITGIGNYNHGSNVTLTANPATGFTFKDWTENGTQVSTDASYSFTVNENRTLVVNFTINSYSINANVLPENSGTISGTGNYDYGSNVTLTATPETGYTFKDWTENGTQISTDETYVFNAIENRTLVANFTINSYSIIANALPENSGTITGIGNYNHGSNVILSATPATGYTFKDWTENGTQISTDETYVFTAIENRTLVANFISSVGTINTESLSDINIYPNPTSTKLFINGLKTKSIISIFDLDGKLLISEQLTNNKIDVSKLATGVYTLKITLNNEIIMKKFIKQ